MTDLFAARSQMAMSLAFHILFAVAGMAMPLLMLIARWGARRGDPVLATLAKQWAKGTAILFAVGAVSGTVLSFELGLLWPTFMRHAGPIIGMPFSLEGFAFFLEAIFLGLFLYGEGKVSARLHLFSGFMVALSGLASGVFVVAVNAWMNAPVGLEAALAAATSAGGTVDWSLVEIDPWSPFKSPAFPTQATHMALAAYTSVAACVLGVHAWALRKRPDSALHQKAAKIAFWTLAVCAPLQALSGDFAAKHIAEYQPLKLAAAESHFHTQRGAPLTIGGWPDLEAREVPYSIQVPKALSFLAFGDLDAEVQGLDAFPEEDWPPVHVVHVSFQVMVACGVALLGLVGLGLFLRWRVGVGFLGNRHFQTVAMVCAPLGLVAVEAGWFVTEVGRQPWIITGVMRTKDAVTPVPHLTGHLLLFTALYVVLGVVVVVLLRAQFLASTRQDRA